MPPEDGMDQAAAAFDAVIKSEGAPAKAAPASKRVNVDRTEGPPEAMFTNMNRVEVDDDSPAHGGGDNQLSEEEILYGKSDQLPPAKGKPAEGDSGDDRDEGDESDDESEHRRDAGEDDEESDDSSQEEGEEDAVLARKVEVTVDGEPVEVTIKEALEGYVRTQTFHQRMNQLDEAKKIVRRAATDAVQNYQYSMNLAQQMEEHMKALIPAEPDWDAEFQKDPAKARDLQRYYEKAKTFRATLKTQLDEAAKKQAESDSLQLQAFAEEESSKFEQANRKHWTDPKRKAKDLQSMRKTGLAAGFSEDELSQVYDSRMLMVLLKASKYDRMMAAKPKPIVRSEKRPIPPGAGSAKSRTAQKGVSSAMKRLNRTGSVEDAAVVMDQIIARG